MSFNIDWNHFYLWYENFFQFVYFFTDSRKTRRNVQNAIKVCPKQGSSLRTNGKLFYNWLYFLMFSFKIVSRTQFNSRIFHRRTTFSRSQYGSFPQFHCELQPFCLSLYHRSRKKQLRYRGHYSMERKTAVVQDFEREIHWLSSFDEPTDFSCTEFLATLEQVLFSQQIRRLTRVSVFTTFS